ncbi:DUF5996 family protein [Henriciella sp.]|uniref:DUF5996 family protein n=1 Tax=Henriciella sp. TaxID=1968823 RepID=UPI00263429FD|nr:DUF5996 family protein [Henriciella sp.]
MAGKISEANDWPVLPYAEWADTCAALHLWTQIVGKYRLAHTPWINHAWHATYYVTPRGITTGPVPDGNNSITLTFDLKEHRLVGESADRTEHFDLEDMSVADFLTRTTSLVETLGGHMDIHGAPNEIPDARPFSQDDVVRPYNRGAVGRYHRALLLISQVFEKFRTGFLGKVSPVHLFWGSFDLAVTRFSGQEAPLHPGGVPALPDEITQEAYSHEVSSAGFWPGGGDVDEPMFYSYAYPVPPDFSDHAVTPASAYFEPSLGEFVLPYEAIRKSASPESDLLSFLQSTYAVTADLLNWDRETLECDFGMPRIPRKVNV